MGLLTNPAKILIEHFPKCKFRLTTNVEIKYSSVNIKLEGYFTEDFENRPYCDPLHDYYRNSDHDISLCWNTEKLILLGGLKAKMLALEYASSSCIWIEKEGGVIARPHPNGEKFEAIAEALYPIMSEHF
ncbi:hypothetical protein Cri9333_0341 [Crinalium epipsammum PCC 9333]|uniref:Uncharacterized protein n=1 Tax=Crinalium epipsammum PCC 9333 TaxID=1173022 RepID=K9VTC4_9CYAN|nr:hypothetical protein [Crinalium epipsammum]AFZ11323.1 hypothetical protein Cri9333_0341 [Crinalium epipsammum PCC 9333]